MLNRWLILAAQAGERAAQVPKRRFLAQSIATFLCVLVITGCGLLRGRPKPPSVRIGSLIVTNTEGKTQVLDVLQGQAQRFADKYAVTVAQAVDEYLTTPVTPEQRIEAVRWKLGQATAAWVDASGPNPPLNVLDLAVLTKVSRIVMENGEARFGPGYVKLLEAHRTLETNVWAALGSVINEQQKQQLVQVIEEWRRKNPGQYYAGVTRLNELALAIGHVPTTSKTGPNNLFSLLFLDPLAGLDPTAAAIEETQRLAERLMYYTQRMPTLLNWQVQLLSLQLAAQPESKQLLSSVDRFTTATEAFASVADKLPQLVNDQREAGIKQVLDGLASERTNLLAGLAAEEKKARLLLNEAKQTLDAGSGMATSVEATIKSLDEFVRFVSPPTNRVASTNSKPFDVLEYGQAAGQVGTMAQQLQNMLTELNQTAPALAKLRQDTSADAERLLHRAFWLAAALSLLVLVGAVGAGLVYRAAAARLQRQEGDAPPRTSA